MPTTDLGWTFLALVAVFALLVALLVEHLWGEPGLYGMLAGIGGCALVDGAQSILARRERAS